MWAEILPHPSDQGNETPFEEAPRSSKCRMLARMLVPVRRLSSFAALFVFAFGCAPQLPAPRAVKPAMSGEIAAPDIAPESAVSEADPSPPCDRSRLAPFVRELLAILEADDPATAELRLLDRLGAAPPDAFADALLDLLREAAEQERAATAKRAQETKITQLQLGFVPRPRAVAPGAIAPPLLLGEGRPQPAPSSLYPYGLAAIPADEMRRHRALPSHLPPAAERFSRYVYAYADHDVLAQPAGGSTRIVVAARRHRPRIFSAPFADIASAQLVGDVLLVSLPRAPAPALASSTARRPNVASQALPSPTVQDGLFAFDAGSGALLWSVPGVVGAVASGGRVVTGAATQLEVYDVETGKLTGAAPLPRRPHALYAHAGKLIVVGSRMEQVFALDSAPAARSPQLEALSTRPILGGGERACGVLTAVQKFAERDLSGLDGALRALAASPHDPAQLGEMQSLNRMRARLAAWQAPTDPAGERPRADTLDLFAAAPTVLPSPPWERTPPKLPTASRQPAPQLEVRRTGAEAYRHWEHPELARGERSEAVSIAPVSRGKLPPGAREDVPPYVGLASLVQFVPLRQDALLLYGERWLAVVRGQRAERLFDLEAYRHPPIQKPKDAFEGSPTAVTAATLDGDVLYLCNGGSYASMARGKTGFVTAIDVRTGALLWQSDALVCKTELLVWRGFLLTAYGFTGEPDFLYALRTADGSRVARLGIENTPGPLRLSGDTLTVFTYEKRITFELGER